MDRPASLLYSQGLTDALFEWRFLALLFIAEFFILWYYLVRKSAKGSLTPLAPLIGGLIIIELIHELLFHFSLVPTMQWFIPHDDPFVIKILGFQAIIYLIVSALFIAYYLAVERRKLALGVSEDGFENSGPSLLLPLAAIVGFLFLQQIIGLSYGLWLFQESDTPRVLHYASILVRDGFNSFVDTWMLPGDYYQMIELDMPVVSIIWAAIHAVVSLFSHAQRAVDISSHLTSLGFFALSLWGTFLLGRELFDRRVGTWAALLLCLTPYYSFMGYLLMTDVPLTALTTVSLYFFVRSVKTDNFKYGLIAGALLFLALMTKVIALYYIGVFILFQIVFYKKRQWRPLVSSGVAVLSGIVLVMIILASIYGGELPGLVGDFIERKLRIVSTEGGRMRQGYVSLYYRGQVTFFFYLQNITAYIGFGVVMLAVASLFMKFKGKLSEAKEHIFLLIWPLAFILYFSFQLTKSSRWIFSVYPALMILAAYAFVKLSERRETRALSYMLLIFIIIEMLFRHVSYYESFVSKIWILREYAIF